MTISIRPMNVDDFARVYKLGLKCYDIQDKPYNYWTLREVATHLEENPDLCIVAEDGDQIVGFVLGANRYEALENTGHLEWIAVAPECRRQGLASRLIETAEIVFRKLGKKQIVADISSENAASRGMARKTGFVEGISVTFFVKNLQ